MSAPFGRHPTLIQYLNWAKTAGCTVKHGVGYADDGRPSRVILIEAPSGRWMAIAEMSDNEYLMPTTIARFDRRLNINSPFFSIDDNP